MNRLMTWVGGALWFVLVFWGVLYTTFPSEAVAAFVSRVVSDRTGGAWAAEVGDARPWWVGLSGSSVVLSSVDGGVEQPVMLADTLAVRLNPWALLRKGRQFYAQATMGDAELSGQISAVDEDGQLRLRRLLFEAEGVPLDLASGAMRGKDGAGVSGEGDINALIDLKVTDGLEKASGTIELHGNGLRITSISVPNQGIPEMELDAAISELDLRLDGKDGVLEVVRGVLRSTLIEVDMTGEVTLGDQWDRSRVAVELEVVLPSWAGSPLEKFQGMAEAQLVSAKCDDGKYHYEVSEVLSRLSFGDLRPKRCKSDRPATGARPTVTSTPAGEVAPPPPEAARPSVTPAEPPPPPPPIEDEVPAEEIDEEKFDENEEDVPEEL